MAIGLARPEYVSRSKGGNACCKSAYNARSIVCNQKTGEIFNWLKREGNVFHEIMLPDHVDKKFLDVSVFSNEVERAENRKDSQLYVEWVLALAKDEDGVDLDFRIETVKEFIKRKEWIKEGLAVQVDIHEPHEGDVNWHAHLLVTTRRFAADGISLDVKKARDLQPVIVGKVVQNVEELQDSLLMRDIQNAQFKARGMSNRADLPGEITQEHVGAVRMRSVFNEAAQRNEERKEAEIELLNSGVRVLEKVTKHMSVFTKGDLTRAVKCIPDSEARARLVEDAISDKSIIPLYREEGNKTQYFTTEAVRDEENKIVRLSQYVANENNVFTKASGKGVNYNKQLADIHSNAGLSEEQGTALSDLILSDSGVRILRGRAGSGKSFVLKQIPLIAGSAGINVIGVAPTHKAKLELASDGFKSTDTIKGMLFKLANGRFTLPKHSLIVVDEAGMVGNDDMRELLRVAATRKCSVILAGDEKQLASVQRGGMFEVFASRYGSSSILDIKRQDSNWGKSVAMNMSAGNVETAVSILDGESRIKWDTDANSSMNVLLSDWSKSDHNISDRLILTVKNKDVAALNHGARQYLKLEGKLTGNEIAVAGNHYMKGDKILITKTNKELGLINGDLAELVLASEGKFTIKLAVEAKDQDKKISFNPSEYNGFRHGYATTVFKAQGASIADVYMFHNGFAGIRNSYVSLSRNKIDLNLYANKKSTSNLNSLIRQLSEDAEAGSSLSYLTARELEYKAISHKLANDKNRFVRGFNSLLDFASNTATKLTDKYIPSSQYYNYKEPKVKYEPANKVIEKTYSKIEEHHQAILEEKMVVGGNIFNNGDKSSFNSASTTSSSKSKDISAGNEIIGVMSNLNITGNTSSAVLSNTGNIKNENANNQEAIIISSQISESGKTRQSAKTRFYANADRFRSQKIYESQKEEWSMESEQLKSELKFKAEYITRDLLGDPNKRLSNGMELRYGDHGKLAVRITGEKAGTWYDFAKGEGGDLFHLAQETRKTSFKEAAQYLRGQVGMSSSRPNPNLQLVSDHANSDLTIDRIKSNHKEEKLNEQKQAYSTKLYERSKDIGEKSVAHRYLSGTRNINVDLGNDIKTAGIYEKSSKGYLPALLAYARDADGNITGGQHLLLDKRTNGKADVDNPKKSFGTISGSFVDLGNTNTKTTSNNNAENTTKSDITIIAEGIETGLSVKQALCEHNQTGDEKTANINIKTLCSLGISNIKNYEPTQGQKIIIASDNDSKNSITEKTTENAKTSLEAKGAFVEIVTPEKQGDFNDVLRDGENGGSKVIADCFKGAIARHSAQTLEEYITNINKAESSSGLKDKQLFAEDKANLTITQKYNVSQETILNAWRSNPDKGREELASTALAISLTEKRLEANRDILDLAAKHGIKVDETHLVKTLLTSSTSSEQECMNHALSGFAKQKQESEKIGHVFNLIKKEDQFLSEVKLNNNKELDTNLQDRLDLSKTNQSKDIISSIKQNIEANHKQGIISYDDLLKTVVASGYDIKGLDIKLKSLAEENREKHLRFMKFDLSQLVKLDHKYDPDVLVNNVKSMSDQEKIIYSNKLLAEHGDKYFNSALAGHIKEKDNATNFNDFMKAIGREQKTLAGLHNDHRFTAQAIDEHRPGKFKMLSLTSSAYDINTLGGMDKVMKTFNYAVKYKITDQEKIMSDLKRTGGNLEQIHYMLDRKCKTNLKTQFKEREKSFRKENQQKLTPEQSSFHKVTLTFDNEPKKDIRKTIESFDIHFNKFRQEWSGNVKEHNLTKLTKSLANEKHYIDIGFKEEYSKPTKQQEIKIDKGFSM